VEAPGIETRDSVEPPALRDDSRAKEPPRVDVSAREPVAFGPAKSTIEEALVGVIAQAAAAGRWDVVAMLARELEARRLGQSGIVSFGGPDRSRR
jgi:hypothetical protein